jgi:hypothetical protein
MISPLLIEYALQFICDETSTGMFKLNSAKVTKSIALAMLYVKGDYYLGEYIAALKHALELAIPFDEQDIVMSDGS